MKRSKSTIIEFIFQQLIIPDKLLDVTICSPTLVTPPNSIYKTMTLILYICPLTLLMLVPILVLLICLSLVLRFCDSLSPFCKTNTILCKSKLHIILESYVTNIKERGFKPWIFILERYPKCQYI